MSFFDLFKFREEREKLSHLKNLVAVAFADGKLEENEMAALAAVMDSRGISPEYLERCINNPKGIKAVKPKSPEQSLEYLKDMVFLMICDGNINEREMSICKHTAISLNFEPEEIDDLIFEIISDLKERMEYKNYSLQILYFYMRSKMSDDQDALLEQTPLKFPVKRIDLETDVDLQFKYNIRVWPTFVLINSNGKELHRWQGLTKGSIINDYIENKNIRTPRNDNKIQSYYSSEEMIRTTSRWTDEFLKSAPKLTAITYDRNEVYMFCGWIILEYGYKYGYFIHQTEKDKFLETIFQAVRNTGKYDQTDMEQFLFRVEQYKSQIMGMLKCDYPRTKMFFPRTLYARFVHIDFNHYHSSPFGDEDNLITFTEYLGKFWNMVNRELMQKYPPKR